MHREIINNLFRSISKYKGDIFYSLLPHFLLLIVIVFMRQSAFMLAIKYGYTNHSSMRIFFVSLSTLVIISAMVKFIRILLVDEKYESFFKSLRFKFRELKFLTSLIFISVIPGILIFLLTSIISIFKIPVFVAFPLSIIILGIPVSRLLFVLPSIAIDKKFGYLDSLLMTRPYKTLNFYIVVVYAGIIATFFIITYNLLMDYLISISQSFSLFNVELWLFLSLIFITPITICYQYVISEEKKEKDIENKIKKSDTLYKIIGLIILILLMTSKFYFNNERSQKNKQIRITNMGKTYSLEKTDPKTKKDIDRNNNIDKLQKTLDILDKKGF